MQARLAIQLPAQTVTSNACELVPAVVMCAAGGCWLSFPQERLASSNRQLRQWHNVLAGKVVALLATDLVRHKDT